MGKVSAFISFALITLLLALIGCGGGSGVVRLDGGAQGDKYIPAMLATGGKFNIPSPIDALSHNTKPRSGSAAALVRLGADFETGLAQNASITGLNATLSPNWIDGTSSFDTLAFAIYRFNVAGYTGDQSLHITWDTPPSNYAMLWIGLSRWDPGRWDWYPGPANGIVEFRMPYYTQPATGDMLVAMVMVGTAPDVLQELHIGNSAGPGDWWMRGRNPLHNARSPFTGPATNALKWSYTTDGAVYSSPALGPDGTVYVGCGAYPEDVGNLYAIYPDGSLKWAYATGGLILSSPAISKDGTVYVGSGAFPEVVGKLCAINLDGSLKWDYATEGIVDSCSPAIGTDGTVYVGSSGGKLYAINADGSLKWSYPIVMRSCPALGTDGTVYVGSGENKLCAINPDGSLKWQCITEGIIGFSSPALGADGTVYVGSLDHKLNAINPDGSPKWSYTTMDWVDSSPAIGVDGTVYVGSDKLYAINPDGSSKWSYTMGDWADSSPAIGADGTVYVGCWDWKLYAITPEGTTKWIYATERYVRSSPAIGADGTVYVGSYDGKLYAIGPGGG